MSRRAHERPRAKHSGHDDAGGRWLPIYSAWEEKRLPLLAAMRDGLHGVGCEVRIDVLGEEPRTLQMLRVRIDGPSIEAAEHRLLRLVKPFDDGGADWANGVDCLLHQRRREYRVWWGTAAEQHELSERLSTYPHRPTRTSSARGTA